MEAVSYCLGPELKVGPAMAMGMQRAPVSVPEKSVTLRDG